MKKLFFITYGGGHANLVKLVAEDLNRNTDFEIIILALTTAYKELKDQLKNLKVQSITDYMHLFSSDIEKIRGYGDKYLEDNYQKNGNVSEEETINYIGLSFFDLVTNYGINGAEKIYKKKGRRAFEPLNAAKKIISFESPDLLISTSSPRFEIASIRAAKQLGIPSLQILDFFENKYNLKEADYIGCSNDQTKKILEKNNMTNSNIRAVGQPSIENTVRLIESIDCRTLYKKIQINPEKPTILVATQKLMEFSNDVSMGRYIDKESVYLKLFDEIAEAKKHDDFNVLLRIHPASESKESYSRILEKYPFIIFSNEVLDVQQSIALCDLLITHSSTVAIEAACAKKKVITFKHFYDIDYPFDEFTKDPFIFMPDLENMSKKIIEVFIMKQKNHSESFMPKNSLKNIRMFIEEILN